MLKYDILEDFAGPGGWDEGARYLDSQAVMMGREINVDAAATAVLAGHHRKLCDVFLDDHLEFAGIKGYIASPPCQTFSTAGKGSGRRSIQALKEAAVLVAGGMHPRDAIAQVQDEALDERSVLVLQPLQVVRDLNPDWVALEQVPNALPVFEVIADLFADMGYSVRTEVLYAEEYGVPQSRKRCILVAVKGEREVPWPTKTHSRYHVRTPDRLDQGYAKWVSMAQALGWSEDELVGFPRKADSADVVTINGEDYRARDLRDADQPSFAVSGKARSWKRYNEDRFNDQSGTAFDPLWPTKRPSTVVAGRGLVQNPGATANRHNGSTKSRNDGVKVSVQEAGVLQSFPADYPWSGTMTSQFQRVGDACPPLLCAAILEPLLAMSGFLTITTATDLAA